MQYGIIKPWAFLLQETHGLPNLYQFTGYHCPSIIDRRFGIDDTAPGKAAIYVRTDIPQEQIDTSQWCTQRQEVVAVLVRRKQTKVILVSVYGKPGSARLNFGWIQHLCRRYLHVPVLVGGDFNAPHTSWGYANDSGRGRQVYSRFRDSSYVLLNEAHVSTRPLTAPNTPDLTWWQGHGLPRWTAEPDCWGSDHTPIHIHLSHHLVKKQRRMTKVINWTELRTSTTLEGATADSIMLELKQVVHKHTTEQTVNQDQPNPDLHLIRLWDQRKQAELQARSFPHNEQLQWEVNRLAAEAKKYETQLSGQRWRDWCESFGSSTSSKKLWRTYHAMETNKVATPRPCNIQLAMGLSNEDFARHAAMAFFPQHDSPATTCPASYAVDDCGITSPITKAELIAAIEATKKKSAPGHDGITYEVFKNLEGPAVDNLLGVLNEVWTDGEIPQEWKHAIIVPIPKSGKAAKDLTALRPISLTPTICKIYERILASRINWWLETKGLYHESQIGFRQLVGAEDGLHRLAQDITKVPGRIQWIRSIVATDISKAYDNIHHAAILDAMVNLQFPHGIIKATHNFLTNRTFSVRVAGENSAPFTANCGVPQGSALAPILFNIAFIQLAWKLAQHKHLKFLIYADDVTLWATHLDHTQHQDILQRGLNTLHEYTQAIGLELSPSKSCYMRVCNNAARKKLGTDDLDLKVGQQTLPKVETMKILGLQIHKTGSAKEWLVSIKKSAHSMLHLINRISQRRGGACSAIATCLVKAILQPRIIYQAQFQNLTETQWNSLETVNRAAMRSITGLPMHTPIKLLQEHAHLNTLRQLCDQRTQARVAKHQLYASECYKETSYIEKIQQLPPWSFSCLTTNKTSRRKARQNPKAHNPNPSSPDHCILYTDAACTQNGGATAFVSRTHPHLDDQKKFATSDASPLLLELQAIYEALLAASKDHSINQVTIFTDSAQAIRHLKQTKQAMNIVQKIHRLRHHFAGMVVIDWVQGHGPAEGNIAAHEAAKRAAQSEDLQSHTLSMDIVATLLATKTRIRASTRALIPPCTARVPPGLSRLQEVLLRRIRTGCAITPAVLSSWRGDHSRIPPGCPHCPAPADQVDVRHLIWTCSGIRADREHYVLQAGIRWDDPEAYKTWTTNNACARSLLDFVHTAGLSAFL